MQSFALLIGIGLATGIASGVFGIGGGVLLVPALIYLAKFPQHTAIGTSLAVLLPPVGLGAVLAYYRSGNVDLQAALIVAAALLVGGWLGAQLAAHMRGQVLQLVFGLFVLGIGAYVAVDAVRALK